MEGQPVLSREYLQGMVAMKNKELKDYHVGQVVGMVSQLISAAASTGATCYLFDSSRISSSEQNMRQQAMSSFQNNQQKLGANIYAEKRKNAVGQLCLNNPYIDTQLPAMLAPSPITTGDIVEALKKKCPDCYVDYQEQWVNAESGSGREVRELKKGIYIDWS